MNQDYRSIYNTQTNTYVAVSSNTPARGKTASARTNIRRCVFGLSAIASLFFNISNTFAADPIYLNGRTDNTVYNLEGVNVINSGSSHAISNRSYGNLSTANIKSDLEVNTLGNNQAIYINGKNSIVNLEGNTQINALDGTGIEIQISGGTLNAKKNTQINASRKGVLVAADRTNSAQSGDASANFENLSINLNDKTSAYDDAGLSAGTRGHINVTGLTSITMNSNPLSDVDNPRAVYAAGWAGDGAKATINLHDLNITMSGEGGTAVKSEGAATINITGNVNILGTGSGIRSSAIRYIPSTGADTTIGGEIYLTGAQTNVNVSGKLTVGLGASFGSFIDARQTALTIDVTGSDTLGVVADSASKILLGENAKIRVSGKNSAGLRLGNYWDDTIEASTITAGDNLSIDSTGNALEIAGYFTKNAALDFKKANITSHSGSVLSMQGAEATVNLTNSSLSGFNGIKVNSGSGKLALNIVGGSLQATGSEKMLLDVTGGHATTLFQDINIEGQIQTNIDTDGRNNTYYNPKALSNNVNFKNARWTMTNSSVVNNLTLDNSQIFFKNLGQTLTAFGDYVGTAGSVISLETKLGDDNSTTDKLHVTGNTSGSTRLEIRNAGGTGAQTVNGINVVQVDGASAADSFTMAAPVQAGAYEYTLKQGSALDANDWYLTSKIGNSSGGNSSGTTGTTTLYRPAVAAYVVAQTANTDATFDLMSSLHQRMGEQRGTSGAPQTWGKIFTAGQSNNGKNRFEYDQLSTGFQFGRDVWSNNTSRAGVTLNYAYSDIDARDSARAQASLAQNTGTIKSTALGLGGYFTQHMSNGMYVDVVGQANHITNKFNDSYSGQSKQKGWQAGLSTEIGKTVGNIGGWNVEPQAQLSYAYGNYKNFADAYSTIGNDNTNSLRGRLGVRLFKDLNISGQAAQYYGIANIGHDFIKPKNVTLSDRTGSTTLNERFDNTYAEIGAGVSGQVSKTTSLHADARYQRSFKGNKEGAHLDVGVKVQF